MVLTHNRVYNNFKSGTEHLRKEYWAGFTNEILVRPQKTLPGLMKTSTNARGETSRASGNVGFSRPGILSGRKNWRYLQTNKQTRKKALLSGSVGTSAAAKRAWKRRARYCAEQASCAK